MPTIALVGDIMLGRGVDAELRDKPPGVCWGTTLPVLEGADAVIGNLECAITEHRRPWSRTPKVFHFRAGPSAIAQLQRANIRAVSLANNHVLDYEEEGFLDTLQFLDRAGIARAGAGRDLKEATAPAMITVAGLRVALLAATDNQPEWAAAPGRLGTWYLDIESDPNALAPLRERAEWARNAGAQLVILSLHWGPNMVTEPPEAFRRFAHGALDFADIVYGHSAHLFQGVERQDGQLILYDTGDFLDDYAVDERLRNDWSFIFLVDLAPTGRLNRLRLLPVQLSFARVDLARGDEFGEIRDCMLRRSRGFGGPLRQTAEGLELDLSTAP